MISIWQWQFKRYHGVNEILILINYVIIYRDNLERFRTEQQMCSKCVAVSLITVNDWPDMLQATTAL